MELITAQEVKTILRVSLSWVYRQAENGRLPAVKIPCDGVGTQKKHVIRFRKSDIEKFISDHCAVSAPVSS